MPPPAVSRLEAVARRVFPAIVALLMLGSQLLAPPITGLSDNGDFYNITAPYQLSPDEPYRGDRYFTYIVPRWVRDTGNPPITRLLSSQVLVAWPAVMFSRVFADGVFELRWMGLVHMVLLALAMLVAEPAISQLSRQRQFVVWTALLLIFCDAAYAVHLNSFYMDAGSFVWLLMAAAFYVRLVGLPLPTRMAAIGFVLSGILFLTSKLQHAYLFPAFVLVVVLDRSFRRVLPRWAVAGSAAALFLCTVPLFRNAPKDYAVFATYNVVFGDLMKNTADPEAILRHFDLPPELMAQRGVVGFAPNSALRDQRYRARIISNLTHGRLLLLYLKRPDEAVRLVKTALTESSREREQGMGNYAKDSGRAPREMSPAYAFYSDLKRFLFYPRPWLYAAFLTMVTAGALWLARARQSGAWVGLLAVAAMSAFEFGVSALADVAETDRHLFLFRAMQDLMLLGLIGLMMPGKTERGAMVQKPLRPSSRQSG